MGFFSTLYQNWYLFAHIVPFDPKNKQTQPFLVTGVLSIVHMNLLRLRGVK